MNAVSNFVIEPKTLTEAMNFATMIASSSFCPSSMKNKPGDVILAMQMGAEVGLSPMQAIQNIAVINGRPALWGDAALAVTMGSPKYVSHREWLEGDVKEGNLTAYCGVTREKSDEHVRAFSMDDAKKAGLWGKTGPWSQYPERMLQMRARAFAIRDKFADVLRGINVGEEVSDYPVKAEYKSNVRALPSKGVDHAALEHLHQQKVDEIPINVDAPNDLEEDFIHYLDEIRLAQDETQLKSLFTAIKKINFKARPDWLKKLIDAKDRRKAELSEASDFPEKLSDIQDETGKLTEVV